MLDLSSDGVKDTTVTAKAKDMAAKDLGRQGQGLGPPRTWAAKAKDLAAKAKDMAAKDLTSTPGSRPTSL